MKDINFKAVSFLFLILATLCFCQSASAQAAKLPFKPVTDWRELPETALIETNKGKFEIAFYRERAPVTVRNFEFLGKRGFYENLYFHRHMPGFVIQGGDPKGTGQGGPGYRLPPELRDLKHERGTIGMAMLPARVNPERLSNGSQFYICLQRSKHLDGLFTVFAKVIDGMHVVDQLRRGDKIIAIYFPVKKKPQPEEAPTQP